VQAHMDPDNQKKQTFVAGNKSNFALLIITFLILLLAGEGIIRFLETQADPELDGKSLEHCIKKSENKNLFWEWVPDTDCSAHYIPIHINTLGLRDYEYGKNKSQDTIRIAAVGDSYTFGWGVQLNQTYENVLESMLKEDRSKNYEVLNFGMPGLNTMEEESKIESEVISFNPDIIIIGYTSADPGCEHIELCNPELFDATRAAYPKGKLLNVKANTTVGRITHKITQKSNFLLFLANRIDDNFFQKYANGKNAIENLHAPDSLTWKNTQAQFQRIQQLAEQNNLKVIIVIFPELDFMNYSKYPFKEVHKQIAEAGKQHKFYVIDLGEYYQQYPQGELSVNPGSKNHDGHPNALAHKIAGEAIYKYMKEEQLI